MDYVIGLDWAKKSWACCQLWTDPGTPPMIHRLAADGPIPEIIKSAARVVVDAPIGLPECQKCAQLRPCDRGAREWVGPHLRDSVQPVVNKDELDCWRTDGVPRRRGHLRGLLPSISSVDRLREEGVDLLESHPELVFAALSGDHLRKEFKKTTLHGVLKRLDLLRRKGLDLADAEVVDEPLPAPDVLDAGAMALVALGWWRSGETLRVIRSAEGLPVPLAQGSREGLMALPENATDPRGNRRTMAP